MNQTIIFNAMLDWRKKEIDPFERAKIISEYLIDHRLSIRKLAEKIGTPKSTIEDWLLFNKITEENYKSMKESGLTPTDIYRTLRNNRKKSDLELKEFTKLDFELDQGIKRLATFQSNYELQLTPETINRVKELRNILNRILLHGEA